MLTLTGTLGTLVYACSQPEKSSLHFNTDGPSA